MVMVPNRNGEFSGERGTVRRLSEMKKKNKTQKKVLEIDRWKG
jgi:hypothetical protein